MCIYREKIVITLGEKLQSKVMIIDEEEETQPLKKDVSFGRSCSLFKNGRQVKN